MIMSCPNPTPTLKSHELEKIVRSIFSNRNLSGAASDLRIDEAFGNVYWRPADSAAAPFELTDLHCFPAASHQTEQCIGILELAGGYRPADLARHFSHLESATGPKPVLLENSNPQLDPALEDLDGEVLMDIDVVDAFTPAAHIVIYFAPQTDRGCVVAWRVGASNPA
jgi:kumamolisin